jgi:hypothetical protein
MSKYEINKRMIGKSVLIKVDESWTMGKVLDVIDDFTFKVQRITDDIPIEVDIMQIRQQIS